MKIRKILSGFLCLMLVVSLAVPAFAKDEPYGFKITAPKGNLEEFDDELGNTNYKTQPNDPATIKCNQSSNPAPGWGFYLHLKSEENSARTLSYWYNNTNYLRHPTYVDLSYANHHNYRIRGRFDNESGGTYVLTGVFNADYTNP